VVHDDGYPSGLGHGDGPEGGLVEVTTRAFLPDLEAGGARVENLLQAGPELFGRAKTPVGDHVDPEVKDGQVSPGPRRKAGRRSTNRWRQTARCGSSPSPDPFRKAPRKSP